MNTKEKVLQKCAELHNPSAPWINDNWELDRMRSKARYSLTKYNNGSLAKYVFDESVPENDPVWPLAAQVLGIQGDEHANLIKGCKEVIESATALYGHLPIYMLGIDAIVNPKPNEV